MYKTLFISILLTLGFPIFAQPEPVWFSHLDVLFIVSGDETITALYRPSFTGETNEETTITLDFPVSGEIVDVQIIDPAIFDQLDQSTVVIPESLPKPCDLSPMLLHAYGPASFSHMVISAETTKFIVNEQRVQVDFHLQTRHLVDMEIDTYETILHQAPAVQITYHASDVRLMPAAENTSVYIIADSFYSTENAVELDLSSIRHSTNEISMTLRDVFGNPAYDSFIQQYRQLLNSASRPVLQYAGTLNETLYAQFAPLFNEQPLLSRLYTSMPETVFIPEPELAPIATYFRQGIDPVYYYGCTTETLYDPALESQLPANRVYVDTLRAYVPLLEGWKFFDFENEFVAAPETLTDDEALRHGRGYASQITVPALGFSPFRVPYRTQYFETLPDISTDPLTRFDSAYVNEVATGNSYIWYWAHPDTAPMDYASLYTEGYAHGVKIRMVAPMADYAANAETYDNLLRWFSTYQYFTHPDLRHTLFLGDLRSHIEIGYPEGWKTSFHFEGSRRILPDGGEIGGVMVELLRISPEFLDGFVQEHYDLSGTALIDAYTIPVAYRAHNRYGFIRLGEFNGSLHLVNFSAPEDIRLAGEEMLPLMAAAMRVERLQNP